MSRRGRVITDHPDRDDERANAIEDAPPVRYAACDLVATIALTCPLCKRLIPAHTPHRCTKLPED
jgi:hypothetical protein